MEQLIGQDNDSQAFGLVESGHASMRKSTNECQHICMPMPMAKPSCLGQKANHWPLQGMFSLIESEKTSVELWQVLLVPPWRSCGMPGSGGASWPA